MDGIYLSADDVAGAYGSPNIDTLPSYALDLPQNGVPQAPWYQSIIDGAVRVGEGFAGAAIVDQYQRAGINYQGPTPYINGGTIRTSGVLPVAGAGGQDQTIMLAVILIAAVFLLRGA